jgi:exonuclease VII small subunit
MAKNNKTIEEKVQDLEKLLNLIDEPECTLSQSLEILKEAKKIKLEILENLSEINNQIKELELGSEASSTQDKINSLEQN